MNVVIKVNDEIKEKMIEYYKDKKRDKKDKVRVEPFSFTRTRFSLLI